LIGGKPNDVKAAAALQSLLKRPLEHLTFDNPHVGTQSICAVVRANHCRIRRLLPLHVFDALEAKHAMLSALQHNSSIVHFELSETCSQETIHASAIYDKFALELELNQFGARNQNVARVGGMLLKQQVKSSGQPEPQNQFPSPG